MGFTLEILALDTKSNSDQAKPMKNHDQLVVGFITAVAGSCWALIHCEGGVSAHTNRTCSLRHVSALSLYTHCAYMWTTHTRTLFAACVP